MIPVINYEESFWFLCNDKRIIINSHSTIFYKKTGTLLSSRFCLLKFGKIY